MPLQWHLTETGLQGSTYFDLYSLRLLLIVLVIEIFSADFFLVWGISDQFGEFGN